MYKGMCVGGGVPLVRLGVGCVRVSLYIDAGVLLVAALRGSYDGFFGMLYVVAVVLMCECLCHKWRWP